MRKKMGKFIENIDDVAKQNISIMAKESSEQNVRQVSDNANAISLNHKSDSIF